MVDTTPEREYESYAPSLYVLTTDPIETQPAHTFGFTRHQSVPPALDMTRDRLPEPWMWW